MAPPRRPTIQLKTEGKLDRGHKNAARFAKQGRGTEPLPLAPLPAEPPAYMKMKPGQVEHWKFALASLPPGVAGSSDVCAFQFLVILWDKLTNGDILPAEMPQLRALQKEFGMTPASRSNVTGTGPTVGDKNEDDPTAEF